MIQAQRKTLAFYLGHKLTDVDAGVRLDAFKKMIEYGIKIQDIESKQTQMKIIKEGMMANSENNIQETCLKFLMPSFISTDVVEISSFQLEQILKRKEE